MVGRGDRKLTANYHGQRGEETENVPLAVAVGGESWQGRPIERGGGAGEGNIIQPS
jgi:hypothetical protein